MASNLTTRRRGLSPAHSTAEDAHAELVAGDNELFHRAVRSAMVNKKILSEPASGATGVSVTPTISTRVQGAGTVLAGAKSTPTTVIPSDIIFDSVSGTQPYNAANGYITLFAGESYVLYAACRQTVPGCAMDYAWLIAETNAALPGAVGSVGSASSNGSNGDQPAMIVFTPASDTNIKLRNTGGSGNLGATQQVFEITKLNSHNIDYVWAATQVQVRVKATGVVVFDSGEVANLSVAVSPALTAATQYEVRARHKHYEAEGGYWMRWSDWRTFTTA